MSAGRWQDGVGHIPAVEDAGHLRLRPDRQGGGRLRPGLRHERGDLGQRGVAAPGRSGRRRGGAEQQRAFFEQCDVVSLHLRLVDATRGIVTAADLAGMKPTALLVNTSRAGLVEPGALVEALAGRATGHGCARRVRQRAPGRRRTTRCFGMDNVVCTPHIGYVTREEWELQFVDIFDQINAFAAGAPTNVVNPEVLDHHRH